MISIVMPAHNELGYLRPAVEMVVEGMRARGAPFEIVVAENGSADDTGGEAKALAGEYGPEVVAISLGIADYGAALKAGFVEAAGDVVVNFDVDFVDLGFLDRAVAMMEEQSFDVVVGSKRSPGAEDQRGVGRRLVTATFSAVLRFGFGLHISDTHGIKAMRRETLYPLVKQSQFGKDIFDTELILRAERAGLRVGEIPVVVTDTRPPRTPIIRRIPRTLLGLAKLRLALGAADRPAAVRR